MLKLKPSQAPEQLLYLGGPHFGMLGVYPGFFLFFFSFFIVLSGKSVLCNLHFLLQAELRFLSFDQAEAEPMCVGQPKGKKKRKGKIRQGLQIREAGQSLEITHRVETSEEMTHRRSFLIIPLVFVSGVIYFYVHFCSCTPAFLLVHIQTIREYLCILCFSIALF